MKGIYRDKEGVRWQCLDCLANGTAEDEADEGIKHYAGCPALSLPSETLAATGMATLSLKLVADSGYECESEGHRITVEQWGEINRILNGAAPSTRSHL